MAHVGRNTHDNIPGMLRHAAKCMELKAVIDSMQLVSAEAVNDCYCQIEWVH